MEAIVVLIVELWPLELFMLIGAALVFFAYNYHPEEWNSSSGVNSNAGNQNNSWKNHYRYSEEDLYNHSSIDSQYYGDFYDDPEKLAEVIDNDPYQIDPDYLADVDPVLYEDLYGEIYGEDNI